MFKSKIYVINMYISNNLFAMNYNDWGYKD